MKNTAVIILAAGKGERMKSELPKVLHSLCGRPMLGFVLDLVRDLKAAKTIAVLGYRHEDVAKHITPGVKVVIQKRVIGTADAVKQALPQLKNFRGTVVVLYGDTPLLKKETIKELIARHTQNNADVTLLTASLEKPRGYGRILRDQYCCISGIVEEKDADDFQKDIKEINTGIMCFDVKSLIKALRLIRPNNRKREYYLTDAVSLLRKRGGLIESVEVSDVNEVLGINSRLELSKANAIMQQRINERIMVDGATIIDPASAFISFNARIGRDTVIYPFTVIENNVKIGARCKVGPFIRLRPGTRLKDDVSVGNFLEVSRSELGPRSQAKHFGYIGDSRIGRAVNIGAGSVTANYDGSRKSVTRIRDNAFIGCDTVLVAPVVVGRGARTGAGSVVTKNRNIADGQTVAGVPARPLKTRR